MTAGVLQSWISPGRLPPLVTDGSCVAPDLPQQSGQLRVIPTKYRSGVLGARFGPCGTGVPLSSKTPRWPTISSSPRAVARGTDDGVGTNSRAVGELYFIARQVVDRGDDADPASPHFPYESWSRMGTVHVRRN